MSCDRKVDGLIKYLAGAQECIWIDHGPPTTIGVSVGDGTTVSVGGGSGVLVGVGTSVSVGVGGGVSVCVGVGVRVGDGVMVRLGVAVDVAEGVYVFVDEGVGVYVQVGIKVGLSVAETGNDAVGEAVPVRVAVKKAVVVGKGVAVNDAGIEVEVLDCFGVLVGVKKSRANASTVKMRSVLVGVAVFRPVLGIMRLASTSLGFV